MCIRDSSTTGEEILSLFHELNSEDVTILLVTHEEEVARQAKRILKMKDGKIIEDQAVKVDPC